MADVNDPPAPPLTGTPSLLLKDMKEWRRLLSQMPEATIVWDISRYDSMPGEQARATISQILAFFPDMIAATEAFMDKYPGREIGRDDMSPEFWIMLGPAQVALGCFDDDEL